MAVTSMERRAALGNAHPMAAPFAEGVHTMRATRALWLLSVLRDRLRSSPRYAPYPIYACLLAATILVASRVPLSHRTLEILVMQPWTSLFYRLAASAALLLAIALGVLGLARPDRRSIVLSALGAGVAAWLAPVFVFGYDVGFAFEMLGFYVRLWLWDLPASLFHDLARGNPTVTLALFTLYLVGLYLGARALARRVLRARGSRLVAAAIRRRMREFQPRLMARG